jgi:hypothetical protein
MPGEAFVKGVVVESDEVEPTPVDCFEFGRRVGEGSVELAAGDPSRPGEEGVEPTLGGGEVELARSDVGNALEKSLPRDDPRREEHVLAARDQRDRAGMVAV